MQASKNGVFYVIEAATGKVISATLFVPTANWLTGFDENFKPIINPEANYGAHDPGSTSCRPRAAPIAGTRWPSTRKRG